MQESIRQLLIRLWSMRRPCWLSASPVVWGSPTQPVGPPFSNTSLLTQSSSFSKRNKRCLKIYTTQREKVCENNTLLRVGTMGTPIPYSWKIWQFGGLCNNCQIKICQNFHTRIYTYGDPVRNHKINLNPLIFLQQRFWAQPFRVYGIIL